MPWVRTVYHTKRATIETAPHRPWILVQQRAWEPRCSRAGYRLRLRVHLAPHPDTHHEFRHVREWHDRFERDPFPVRPADLRRRYPRYHRFSWSGGFAQKLKISHK